MPKSPQKWPFLNRAILGLGRDTHMCDYSSPWSRLLNRHGHVVYPCKLFFDPAKGTRPCEEVQAVLFSNVGPFSPFSARFSLFLLSYAHLSIKHEIKGLGASNSPNLRRNHPKMC